MARRRTMHPVLLIFLGTGVYVSLYVWNHSYVVHNLEAPLDHVTSTLFWKPIYSIWGCPDMNTQVIDNKQTKTTTTVPFYMMSARPKHLVDPVLASYDEYNYFNVTIYNTTDISRKYKNTRCQSESFKSRLFGIYQIFLQDVIADYIVTVEDDVVLLDAEHFQQELQIAMMNQYEYYSFTKNTKVATCIYRFGTTAQLWSRRMIQKILTVDTDTFCRLPIDMFIAQQGPWYVTQRNLVQHVGTKRLTHVGRR